jgi:hypothetical protein
MTPKEVKMSYRGDFYIPENIIGYTGFLASKPTVYFQRQFEFGRITQDHKNVDNVGRNRVRNDPSYTIQNIRGRAVERWSGGRHASRNPFIQVSDASRSILALAIGKFPDIKPKAWRKLLG